MRNVGKGFCELDNVGTDVSNVQLLFFYLHLYSATCLPITKTRSATCTMCLGCRPGCDGL